MASFQSHTQLIREEISDESTNDTVDLDKDDSWIENIVSKTNEDRETAEKVKSLTTSEKMDILTNSEEVVEQIKDFKPHENPILCRSVRIGSYRLLPKGEKNMCVYLTEEGLSFTVPVTTEPNHFVQIILQPCDVKKMLYHIGKHLPVMFILTTDEFADAVRAALNMTAGVTCYFDPKSKNNTEKMITFLLDGAVTRAQVNYLRSELFGADKVMEINLQSANEFLVRTTAIPKANLKGEYKKIHSIVQSKKSST